MSKFLAGLTLVLVIVSCSNTPEKETGEIKALQLVKQAFFDSTSPKVFIDARNLLSREQVDAANTPVLFIELESGQNGTLTPYPGQGIGQTWLGADGATVTFERGVLKASRGMGDDLMGSYSSMPKWSQIKHNKKSFHREFRRINGNNQISIRIFKCQIRRNKTKEVIEIWKLKFRVTKFEENCYHNGLEIKNNYYLDDQEIVRKSSQYHGDTIGYLVTERLDR